MRKNNNVTPPEIPENLFEIADDESFFMELFTHEPFDSCAISKLNLTYKDLNDFSTYGCVVSGVRFNDATAFRGEYYDTIFKGCDFSGANLTDSTFKRCVFKNCKGVGANFSRSSFADVSFEGGNFDYANFNVSKIQFAKFSEITFKNAEMSGCNVKNITLDDVDFTRVNFSRTLLSEIDLTKCELDGIAISQGFVELKGAIVTSYQASRLAVLLGLVIK